jgi:hypothetical protein
MRLRGRRLVLRVRQRLPRLLQRFTLRAPRVLPFQQLLLWPGRNPIGL